MRESLEIIYPRTAAERAMKLQEALLRTAHHDLQKAPNANSCSPPASKDCGDV